MFEEVFLYECGDMNEDEYFGYAENQKINFKAMLDWMHKVHANENAKFLKCLIGSAKGITVNNIVDITFSSNLAYKDKTVPHGIKIAFKEGEIAPAMELSKAAELFDALAVKCAEVGVDPADVEVFCENEKGRLTQFCWYYDTDTDTACIVKNMTHKVAAKFMHGATDVVARIAKTSRTPDSLIAKLEKIDAQMKALADRRASVEKQFDALPPQA